MSWEEFTVSDLSHLIFKWFLNSQLAMTNY